MPCKAHSPRQLGPRTIEEIEQQRQVELTAKPRHTARPGKLVESLELVRQRSSISRCRNSGDGPQNTLDFAICKRLASSKQDIDDRWLITSNFLSQLREMKAIQDRARTLFRAGVSRSAIPHAPMEYSTSAKKLIGARPLEQRRRAHRRSPNDFRDHRGER